MPIPAWSSRTRDAMEQEKKEDGRIRQATLSSAYSCTAERTLFMKL